MPKPKRQFAKCFRRPYAWGAVCCLAGFVPSAKAQPGIYNDADSSKFVRIPSDADDWTRHFRVGALVGFNLSADFKMQGGFGISGNDPANGIFADGYVRTDQTGNARGHTSYWGYNSASQYDAVSHTLKMTALSDFNASGGGHDDKNAIPGFELAYGGNLWYWKHARVGWELGFGLLSVNISDNRTVDGTITQSVYTFDTGNIDVPGAPYQGGSSGQGTLISATGNKLPGPTTTSGTVSGSHSLDVSLYTIRLGPSFYWDVTERIGVSLGAGPAIGVASGKYSYNETITTSGSSAHSYGKIDGADVVYGGYVNATVMYHFNDSGRNADVYVSAQYMPMGNAGFGGGGREGTLNLGGQIYLSAGLNWPF